MIIISTDPHHGALALLSSALVSPRLFFVVYLLAIAYSLLYLAYIPSGPVRAYNCVGGYSYGVYIYAFPVQQSVVALIPGVSVLLLLLISACINLSLALLSWHFIERRALAFKGCSTRWGWTSPSLRPMFLG